jgi:hypothetical protein
MSSSGVAMVFGAVIDATKARRRGRRQGSPQKI